MHLLSRLSFCRLQNNRKVSAQNLTSSTFLRIFINRFGGQLHSGIVSGECSAISFSFVIQYRKQAEHKEPCMDCNCCKYSCSRWADISIATQNSMFSCFDACLVVHTGTYNLLEMSLGDKIFNCMWCYHQTAFRITCGMCDDNF